MSDPQVTVYTVLSKDVELLRWCIGNARERAGVDAEYLLVHWVNADLSDSQLDNVERTAAELGMRLVVHSATRPDQHPTSVDFFLKNLYRAWNLGYAHSHTKYVARLGSDQFFSKGWLAELMRASAMRDDNGTFHTWTVESPVAKHSRHEVRDFGSTWDTFDVSAFDFYAKALISQYSSRNLLAAHECRLFYNHPFRRMQCRPDGCTWLQTKDLWGRFGPLEDTINAEGVTGDVAYMDRLSDAKIPAYLVPPSVTYHLVRGESREQQA